MVLRRSRILQVGEQLCQRRRISRRERYMDVKRKARVGARTHSERIDLRMITAQRLILRARGVGYDRKIKSEDRGARYSKERARSKPACPGSSA